MLLSGPFSWSVSFVLNSSSSPSDFGQELIKGERPSYQISNVACYSSWKIISRTYRELQPRMAFQMCSSQKIITETQDTIFILEIIFWEKGNVTVPCELHPYLTISHSAETCGCFQALSW